MIHQLFIISFCSASLIITTSLINPVNLSDMTVAVSNRTFLAIHLDNGNIYLYRRCIFLCLLMHSIIQKRFGCIFMKVLCRVG